MAENENFLEKQEFINWIKAILMLKQLKRGLEGFVEEGITNLHGNIIASVKQQLSPGQTEVPKCTTCTVRDLKRKDATCPNMKVCQAILWQIETHHRSGKASLESTNNKLWSDPLSPWEIGKCFIGPGYSHTKAPSGADCTGILSVIIHCTWIQKNLDQDTEAFHEVKELRNSIVHSSDLTLRKTDLDNLCQCCCKILQDPKSLKTNQDAQQALEEIRRIESSRLVVSEQDIIGAQDEVNESLNFYPDDEEDIKPMKQNITNLEKIRLTTAAGGTLPGNGHYANIPIELSQQITGAESVVKTAPRKVQNSIQNQKYRLVVAAIEIGTAYSGFAYAFVDEIMRDSLKIYTNEKSCSGAFVTSRFPTAVLFDKTGKFHSFGYEAEDDFADLIKSHEQTGWRYFRRFKQLLMKGQIKSDTKVQDTEGSDMLVMDVFAAMIKYLKDNLLKEVDKKADKLKNFKVLWLLTVPEALDADGHQFLRESACTAGIPESDLRLVTESEAAAMYCNEVFVKESDTLSFPRLGPRFMVIDLGETAAMSVFEAQEEELRDTGEQWRLSEVFQHNRENFAGSAVDKAIEEFQNTLFTETVARKLHTDLIYSQDCLELQRSIEMTKRTVDLISESRKLRLRMTILVSEIFENTQRQCLRDSLKERYASTVAFEDGKLLIAGKYLIDIYINTTGQLVDHIRTLLCEPTIKDLETLMFVGGLSEIGVIRAKIKEAFPQSMFNVLIPQDAGMAVMKGAVIVGFHKYIDSQGHED